MDQLEEQAGLEDESASLLTIYITLKKANYLCVPSLYP